MPMTNEGIERLKADEGFAADVYLCPAGAMTIGYGHNLDANPLNIKPPITEEEAHNILIRDLTICETELLNTCFAYKMLAYRGDAARADVLLNMAFNMGVRKFSGFRKTLNLIMNKDYSAAAAEMLKSRWAKQVGKRADRLSEIMRTGKY